MRAWLVPARLPSRRSIFDAEFHVGFRTKTLIDTKDSLWLRGTDG